MLTTQEIREKFVTFFTENGHEKLESSSLIPQNDPTIMFANAGMNQFKDYFTGKAVAKNPRAVTIQKCVRAGGKHNDLENVGLTARHHTFFEMLGNFSFGDYFKSEAIRFAWKFLTEELKIPKDKLYVTVHDSDEEARKIWHEQEGIPLDRIFYMGDKDNFWEMGELGPCGPCSEIFYDHGPENTDGNDTSECILHDEGRYVEIWNLVFMQFEKFKNDAGKIERRNLPKPSIDTGAGLERLVACMQNVYWNYDGDVFTPVLAELEKISGKKYSDKKYTSSMRIIADHIRASVMLITDGIIPSNEGRGYVLRRIIRRAIKHLDELGISEISFYKLIPAVFNKLKDEYPQNLAGQALAEKLLMLEEESFRKTLKSGLELLKKEIKGLKAGDTLAGNIVFKFYDTYGFPKDLTEILLQDKGLKVDHAGFEQAMKKQKEQSKASSKFSVQEDNIKAYYQVKESCGESTFEGYDSLEMDSELIAIVPDGEMTGLVFRKTPFYPEGGGQAGDLGSILSDGINFAEVLNTLKPVDGVIVHYAKLDNAEIFKIGTSYNLRVNKFTRELSKANHSATHLLQAALIEVLGDHIKQAGSRVSHESLRFDFTHPEAVKPEELLKVESLVNSKIAESLNVEASLMSKDEATKKGAMALFGEKYGAEVRVLEMGDFSLELCGGTHVANTKEIGLFSITSETSLASGVRRIEALSSSGAFNYLQTRSQTLQKIEKLFSTEAKKLSVAVTDLQRDLKNKNKEIKKLQDQLQSIQAKDMFNGVEKLSNGTGLLSLFIKDANPKDFRSLSDKFIDQNKEDVLFIYTIDGGKISYLLRTDRKNKNIHCSNTLKACQEIVSGRGGGKPDMAQGSGEASAADAFINKIKEQLSL